MTTRNPKKIRQRLNAGVCNLEATGFKQLNKHQQRKITMFCLELAQHDPNMVNQHNRRNSPGALRRMDLVSSIESMVDRVE